MKKITLPSQAAEALPTLAEIMRESMQGHILREGPAPGEYEQGFVDGFEMATQIVQAAANGLQIATRRQT